jgi:uncharacterized membrane protein
MKLQRIARHLFSTTWTAKRTFSPEVLEAIERGIRETEASHHGQIRFAVEHALDVSQLMAGMSARDRAVELFGQLRVWDTEHNNGVLIYLLLADRDVEIVADRGIHRCVGEGWEAICRDMERHFRQDEFQTGVLDGIRAVGRHLQRHYPREQAGPNELPDRPVVL